MRIQRYSSKIFRKPFVGLSKKTNQKVTPSKNRKVRETRPIKKHKKLKPCLQAKFKMIRDWEELVSEKSTIIETILNVNIKSILSFF